MVEVKGDDMERSQIDGLLVSGSGNIFLLSRSALNAGAAFKVGDHAVPAEHLVSIYSRRERHAHRAGQPSIGFTQAVASLREYGKGEVVIGSIDDRPRGGYYFQLFLSQDLSRIVACLGVKPSQAGPLDYGES